MEDESSATSAMYFCHMCSLIIRPVTSIDELKCPHCHTGFVEEMAGAGRQRGTVSSDRDRAAAAAAAAWANADAAATEERDVALWAPVLMYFLAASSGSHDGAAGDLAAFERRQYRNTALMQLLTALQQEGIAAGRERVVLVSPADARAMFVQGRAGAGAAGMTLGDLFVGPGMDLLLEYLAETDPSRQGTPPATKEAVAALPTVRVREATTCPVCLDELAAGAEAREMPCKHAFHDQCILPWLDMHSSCPVCRYQLPATEEPPGTGSGNEHAGARGNNDAGSGGGRRHWFSWPFGGLFSQRSNRSSSSS